MCSGAVRGPSAEYGPGRSDPTGAGYRHSKWRLPEPRPRHPGSNPSQQPPLLSGPVLPVTVGAPLPACTLISTQTTSTWLSPPPKTHSEQLRTTDIETGGGRVGLGYRGQIRELHKCAIFKAVCVKGGWWHCACLDHGNICLGDCHVTSIAFYSSSLQQSHRRFIGRMDSDSVPQTNVSVSFCFQCNFSS